jgi:hypothetical protein
MSRSSSGSDPSAKVRRADQVHEHECELTALGRYGWPSGLRTRRQAANGIKHLPPMADGLDSDLLEIVSCQTSQHLKVDSVLPESLLIRLQA